MKKAAASTPHTTSFRAKVRTLLASKETEEILKELGSLPLKRSLNGLLACFYDKDPLVRWKAISAFGMLMGRLAAQDKEQARIMMRRLMWSLNDESGGIGWGAPEAMAEAMYHSKPLADEYIRILLSYIREDGNFLEYPPLRSGALWGLARLSEKYPDMLMKIEAPKYVFPYLKDETPEARAYAVMALTNLNQNQYCEHIRHLLQDKSVTNIFDGRALKEVSLDQVAQKALDSLDC